jgi:hypothetical protein
LRFGLCTFGAVRFALGVAEPFFLEAIRLGRGGGRNISDG